MKNNKRYIYISVVMLILLVGVKFGYDYLSSNYKGNEAINNVSDENSSFQPAVDFTVYDKDNNKVKLSDYKGKKAVVVNFWASWCSPCKYEMPHFQEAANKYKNEDLEILMVNLTDGMRETKGSAERFMIEEGYNMNVMFDIELDAANKYQLNAIPRTVFIDKEGNLVYDHVGIIDKEILDENINKILN
ncbi:TlpA family protein disulfide reductase [Clostridium sporogenes]|uniref:TlpA family protein disulfide reductase n=1 Tax=Clostridium sporogenes TaxID=1509 RepID=UPI002149DD3F|nr:TlpA disulfide reductase family protein [Clostridium sporogenes]EKS4343453.1 TlpA family protein disulfide reductase [Clostridium botulinum]EKS4394498.1 TlpA family protein disulfide reductase [Clostridium botulinum]MCR1972948.1 TlpA family protein disulfide reductase [Clostridium sporogenes]